MKVKSRALAERERKSAREARQKRREAMLERRKARREEEKLRRAENGELPVVKAKRRVKNNNHGMEQVDAIILKVLGRSLKARKVASKSSAKMVGRPEVAGPKWRHGMREEKYEGRCVKRKGEKKAPVQVPRKPTFVEEKQEGKAGFHQVVQVVDVGPDHEADGGHCGSGDGAPELAWPLPIQIPLEPMPVCMEFYKVRKLKQVTVSLIKHMAIALSPSSL